MKENEGWYYEWADKYDVWNDHSYKHMKKNEPGTSHTLMDDNSILKFTKTKHNGRSKTSPMNEVRTSIKLEFHIGKRQSSVRGV